jgi:hypothetical protein
MVKVLPTIIVISMTNIRKVITRENKERNKKKSKGKDKEKKNQ